MTSDADAAGQAGLTLPTAWCNERPELRQLVPPGDVTLHSEQWNLKYGTEHACEVHVAVKDADIALDAVIAGAVKLGIKLTLDDRGTIRGHTPDLEIYLRDEHMLGELHLILTLKRPAQEAARLRELLASEPSLAVLAARLPKDAIAKRVAISHEIEAPIRSQLEASVPARNRAAMTRWLTEEGFSSSGNSGLWERARAPRASANLSVDSQDKQLLTLSLWVNPL